MCPHTTRAGGGGGSRSGGGGRLSFNGRPEGSTGVHRFLPQKLPVGARGRAVVRERRSRLSRLSTCTYTYVPVFFVRTYRYGDLTCICLYMYILYMYMHIHIVIYTSGRHIRLLRTSDLTKMAANGSYVCPNPGRVASLEVPNIWTLCNRKFDQRFYVLLPSLDPLIILVRRGYLRVSSFEYSREYVLLYCFTVPVSVDLYPHNSGPPGVFACVFVRVHVC